MAERLRAIDWRATPMGPIETWPSSLCTALGIVLRAKSPMFLAWGPALVFFHNDAYVPILGDRHEGALGQRFPDLWPDAWPEVEPLVALALRGEGSSQQDHPFVLTRNGRPERAWFTFSYLPVPDHAGTIGGLICTVSETTRAVEAHARLRQSEERFRDMADRAPVMVWVTDPSGACTYLNDAWFAFTGQDRQRALGFGWLEATHPDDRDRAEAEFLRANAERRPVRIEYRLRRHDGAWRWAIDAAAPRFADDGAFLGFVGSVIDIDERKAVEDALHEADARKDAFLAMLAHELRAPLAPLANGLRLLERGAAAGHSGPVREMMLRQLQHLVRLVDDLLDLGRVRSGKIVLRREPVLVQDAIQAALRMAQPLMEVSRHELRASLPPGPVWLDADETRLVQVFGNVLSNAARYTPVGGRIELVAEARPTEVVVRVRDDGVGIPVEALARIFEPFEQVRAGDGTGNGGLGLGLALVRSLVELHGGSVTADSDGPGTGAAFTIRLPRPAQEYTLVKESTSSPEW